jgi:hypothetical protein
MTQAFPVPLLRPVDIHAGGAAIAVTNAVDVVLDRAIGMDHRRSVLAVQATVAEPFLAAAGKDASRPVCAIELAFGVTPLDRAIGSDRSLVCHDRSLPVERRSMRGRSLKPNVLEGQPGLPPVE